MSRKKYMKVINMIKRRNLIYKKESNDTAIKIYFNINRVHFIILIHRIFINQSLESIFIINPTDKRISLLEDRHINNLIDELNSINNDD